MTSSPEVALTHPPRRDSAAAPDADALRAAAPAPPPGPAREDGIAPPRRDTFLGDLVFLLRFAFGRY